MEAFETLEDVLGYICRNRRGIVTDVVVFKHNDSKSSIGTHGNKLYSSKIAIHFESSHASIVKYGLAQCAVVIDYEVGETFVDELSASIGINSGLKWKNIFFYNPTNARNMSLRFLPKQDSVECWKVEEDD